MNPSEMLNELYKNQGVDIGSLPFTLQELIAKFNSAFDALNKADKATYNRLIPILVKTSAVIASEIPKYTKPVDQSKLRMLELKAKARARKLKLQNSVA